MGRVCVVCIDAEACERGESAHACPDGCGGKDAVCGECYRALPKCVYCRGEAWKARQPGPGPGPVAEPSEDEEARGLAAACLLMVFLVLGWTTMVCAMVVVVHGPAEAAEAAPQGSAG